VARHRRGAPVLEGLVQRAARLQPARAPRAPAAAGRLRPRPRQPEPRLRPAAHRAAAADDRHPPPPDLQGPRARDGPRTERQQAAPGRPLVLVHQDAGQGGQGDAAHRRGERELDQGHQRGLRRAPRPHAARARGRRSRPLPAATPHRAPARAPDHHGQRRRRAEGPCLPARGAGQAPDRAGRHADGHRQAQAGRPGGGDDRAPRADRGRAVRVRRARRAHRRALRRSRVGRRTEPLRRILAPGGGGHGHGGVRGRHDRRGAARGHRGRRRHRALVPGRRRRRPRRRVAPRPRRSRPAGQGR